MGVQNRLGPPVIKELAQGLSKELQPPLLTVTPPKPSLLTGAEVELSWQELALGHDRKGWLQGRCSSAGCIRAPLCDTAHPKTQPIAGGVLSCSWGEGSCGHWCVRLPLSVCLSSTPDAKLDVQLKLVELQWTQDAADGSEPPSFSPRRPWHPASIARGLQSTAFVGLSQLLLPDQQRLTWRLVGAVGLLEPAACALGWVVRAATRKLQPALGLRNYLWAPMYEEEPSCLFQHLSHGCQVASHGCAMVSRVCREAAMQLMLPTAAIAASQLLWQLLHPGSFQIALSLAALLTVSHDYQHLSRERALGRIAPGCETEATWHACHKRCARRLAHLQTDLHPHPPLAPLISLFHCTSVAAALKVNGQPFYGGLHTSSSFASLASPGCPMAPVSCCADYTPCTGGFLRPMLGVNVSMALLGVRQREADGSHGGKESEEGLQREASEGNHTVSFCAEGVDDAHVVDPAVLSPGARNRRAAGAILPCRDGVAHHHTRDPDHLGDPSQSAWHSPVQHRRLEASLDHAEVHAVDGAWLQHKLSPHGSAAAFGRRNAAPVKGSSLSPLQTEGVPWVIPIPGDVSYSKQMQETGSVEGDWRGPSDLEMQIGPPTHSPPASSHGPSGVRGSGHMFHVLATGGSWPEAGCEATTSTSSEQNTTGGKHGHFGSAVSAPDTSNKCITNALGPSKTIPSSRLGSSAVLSPAVAGTPNHFSSTFPNSSRNTAFSGSVGHMRGRKDTDDTSGSAQVNGDNATTRRDDVASTSSSPSRRLAGSQQEQPHSGSAIENRETVAGSSTGLHDRDAASSSSLRSRMAVRRASRHLFGAGSYRAAGDATSMQYTGTITGTTPGNVGGTTTGTMGSTAGIVADGSVNCSSGHSATQGHNVCRESSSTVTVTTGQMGGTEGSEAWTMKAPNSSQAWTGLCDDDRLDKQTSRAQAHTKTGQQRRDASKRANTQTLTSPTAGRTKGGREIQTGLALVRTGSMGMGTESPGKAVDGSTCPGGLTAAVQAGAHKKGYRQLGTCMGKTIVDATREQATEMAPESAISCAKGCTTSCSLISVAPSRKKAKNVHIRQQSGTAVGPHVHRCGISMSGVSSSTKGMLDSNIGASNSGEVHLFGAADHASPAIASLSVWDTVPLLLRGLYLSIIFFPFLSLGLVLLLLSWMLQRYVAYKQSCGQGTTPVAPALQPDHSGHSSYTQSNCPESQHAQSNHVQCTVARSADASHTSSHGSCSNHAQARCLGSACVDLASHTQSNNPQSSHPWSHHTQSNCPGSLDTNQPQLHYSQSPFVNYAHHRQSNRLQSNRIESGQTPDSFNQTLSNHIPSNQTQSNASPSTCTESTTTGWHPASLPYPRDPLWLRLRKSAWLLLRFGCMRSGAAFIKWAQWAATRGDLFPEDLCSVLCVLQDGAPKHSMAHSRRAIERAFGKKLEDIFLEFDEAPLASGSIAQVHKAQVLHQGRPCSVVAKVVHPGSLRCIFLDFQLLKPLAALAGRVRSLRGLHLKETMSQFSHTMTAQVDMRVEAAHLLRFNRNFQSVSSAVVFPKPLLHLVSEEVLVETFEDGRSVRDFMKRPGPFNTQIVAKGVDTYLKMLLQDNFIHTDLHPGNILIRPAPHTDLPRHRHTTGGRARAQAGAQRGAASARAVSGAQCGVLSVGVGLCAQCGEDSDGAGSVNRTGTGTNWEQELIGNNMRERRAQRASGEAEQVVAQVQNRPQGGERSAQEQRQDVVWGSSGSDFGTVESPTLRQQVVVQGDGLHTRPQEASTEEDEFEELWRHQEGGGVGVPRPAQLVLLDCGLAEELTLTVRMHFVSLLNHISSGNGKAAACHVLKWSPHQSCPDPDAFTRDMVHLFQQHCNIHAPAGIDLDLVMKAILALVRQHELDIDSSYATLVVSVCVLLGFATSLDPGVNLMDAATPALLAYNLTGRVMGRMYQQG